MQDLSDVLTLDEAAEFLGVTRRTLNRWRKDKTLDFPEAARIGLKKKVYLKNVLQVWVRGQLTGGVNLNVEPTPAITTPPVTQKPDVKQVRVDVNAGRRDATPKTSHVTPSKPVVERKKNDYEKMQEMRKKYGLSDYSEDEEKPTTTKDKM